MRINFGKLHYNTREPAELDIPLEKPALLSQLVHAHLKDLGFSIADLAKLLHLLPEECGELYAPDLVRPGLRLIVRQTA
jgi:hypothetical protein